MSLTIQIIGVILCFIGSFVTVGILKSIPGFLPDIPNPRSSHTRTMPRSGGIGFILPVFISMFWIAFNQQPATGAALVTLALGSLTFALIGLMDDAFALSAQLRLFLQLVAGIAVCSFGGPDRFNLFGLIEITGKPVLFIQILWLVGCVNFFNFMDGIDGLAGFQAIFVSLLLGFTLSIDSGNLPPQGLLYNPPEMLKGLSLIFFSLSAAMAGFLIWNLPPARIFMGDNGSYFLGFLFGYCGIILPFNQAIRYPTALIINHEYSPVLLTDFSLIFLLLSPFIFDAAITLWLRFREKRNVFQAHRDHLYQLLFRRGWGRGKILLFFQVLNGIVLLYALLRFLSWSEFSTSVLTIVTMLIIVTIFGFYRHRLGDPPELSSGGG